jgi:hypothetical protein
MNSPWASLNFLLPPTRTPRQRTVVAGGALLLLAGLGWSIWTLLAPQELDYSKQWFTVEFTTDNQAHPVHLTLPDGKEGMFDILMIENLSDKPLSLLAFSSRPRVPGLPPDQIMSTWAQWIATSRQGIIVEPHSAWVLNPNELDRLPAFHGHTWISVFFSHERHSSASTLPASVLPALFGGRFKIHYRVSQLPEEQVSRPQLHRQQFVQLLQTEADETVKISMTLANQDIGLAAGLSNADLR